LLAFPCLFFVSAIATCPHAAVLRKRVLDKQVLTVLKKILSALILANLLAACTGEQPAIIHDAKVPATEGAALPKVPATTHAKRPKERSEKTSLAKSSSKQALSGPCQFTEYRSDFSKGMHQWFALTRNSEERLNYSVLQPRPPGVVVASGESLEVDTNHLDSGPLYLFAIAWTDSRLSTFPVASFDVAADEKRRGLGVPCLNLAGTRLTMRAKSEALDLHGGELVFWMQSRDHYIGKAVNYAFTKSPIDPRLMQGEFRNVCIELTDSLDDWTCLGTNKSDQRLIYGCSPNQTQFREALTNVIYNLGFIVRYDKSADGSVPVTQAPTGALLISDIKISAQFADEESCDSLRAARW